MRVGAARPLMPTDRAAADSLVAALPLETRTKLDRYEAELRRWQTVKNLVGPGTLAEIRIRHVADALQLAPLADGAVWVDLGTGAGLPGLILAIARPNTLVHLVESDGRKCAFLRHVARVTEAPVKVWDGRIEAVLPRLDPKPEVVTARALARLDLLLGYSEQLLMTGAIGLFPKGRDHAAELTRAAESWRFGADVIPSRIDPDSRIIRVHRFGGRAEQTGRS